ncbi:MAG: hypothetical protein K5855_04920 [Oscillospiraceae bacterium]|nr:hypothetical protein [Oscillospiraceae bacterium]
MSKEEKKQTKREQRKQRLNEAGERWYRDRTAGDDAAAKAESVEIFELAFALFDEDYFRIVSKKHNTIGIENPDPGIAITYFYNVPFEKFDPNKATLYHYMNNIFNWRFFDIYQKEYGFRKVKRTDPETGKQKTFIMTEKALQAESQDGDSTEEDRLEFESLSQQGDEYVNDTETTILRKDRNRGGDLRMIALLSDFCSLMLNLPEHLRGNANNPEKHRYYRMFFTEILSMYMKKEPWDLNLVQKKETEVFQAMLISFLDFYMSKECRTCLSVSKTKLKNYSELVEGRPEEEPREIYNDIYLSYLDRIENIQVGESAVSNQWVPFCKLIIDALGIEIVSVHTTKKKKNRTTEFLIRD